MALDYKVRRVRNRFIRNSGNKYRSSKPVGSGSGNDWFTRIYQHWAKRFSQIKRLLMIPATKLKWLLWIKYKEATCWILFCTVLILIIEILRALGVVK